MLKFGTNFVNILAVLELDPFGAGIGSLYLRSKLRREQLCGQNFARSNFARCNFARCNSLGPTLGMSSGNAEHLVEMTSF